MGAARPDFPPCADACTGGAGHGHVEAPRRHRPLGCPHARRR